MSISSTGLYGSATIVNSDLFTDVETLKETVTTLNTTYLQTTEEHRNDISQNLSKINDISNNRIVVIETDITDLSFWLLLLPVMLLLLALLGAPAAGAPAGAAAVKKQK